ncbi:helix-turn-helix domain-containing protein [Fundidesulfovibrio terrae]|uniref:helix-turn-helix domain-containing protein n=1 Tax=Fundidesulfovibrio terrae TaxID=2922866 RepID=UPI001FAE79A7|nr:helix-turn-helix domain-containing protein [Fundidesulfovibrio terrae]
MQELHGESPGGVHAGEHKKESRTEGKSVRPDGKRKQERGENTHASQASQPKRFNPWQQFIGAMIPNALMRYPGLSDLAKLVWGRLAQYAGQNGACYPTQATLAIELATNERQIRRALGELVQEQFLEMVTRGRAGTRYYFLWHPCFDQAQPLPKGPTRTTQFVQRVEDIAKNNPDMFDRNPDKLSAQENQEENQKYHTHHRRLTHNPSGEVTEFSSLDVEAYIALRTRHRVSQGENGTLPKLLVPGAYADNLRGKYHMGSLRTGDYEYLKGWAREQEEKIYAKQKQADFEAYRKSPEGQALALKAAKQAETMAVEGIKQKFLAWRATKNQEWSWEDLAREAEEWAPVVHAPHWHEIRFKWHIPTNPSRIRAALRELIAEEVDRSQRAS